MGQTTFFSKTYIDWPPVAIRDYADPDSGYWESLADLAIAEFDRRAPETLSHADWDRFNQLFHQHYGDALTWKQAHDCYRQAAAALAPGVSVEALAYACGVLPEGSVVYNEGAELVESDGSHANIVEAA